MINNPLTEITITRPSQRGLALDRFSDAQLQLQKAGIRFSADRVTQATAQYPETQRNLVRWLHAHILEQGWNWKQAARETGIDGSTLHKIWSGKYVQHSTGKPVDLTAFCATVAKYKAAYDVKERDARINELSENSLAPLPFIETSVYRRLSKLCKKAHGSRTFLFVYGEPQTGKTTAAREIARRSNFGLIRYCLTPCAGTFPQFIAAIAEASHVSTSGGTRATRSRLEEFCDETRQLFLDEIHELFVTYSVMERLKCLSYLRQLQEKTGMSIVLCGSNIWRTEIESGQFAQSLTQLRKRGIWELQLENSPTPEDLRMISEFYRLGEPTKVAARLVEWVAREQGIGKYTRYLTDASARAHRRNVPFDWTHFVDVVGDATKLRTLPGKDNDKSETSTAE